MKRILIILSGLLLAGCSSFKLGTMLYCPFGAACSLQTVTPARDAAEAPAPAASA